MYNGEVGGKGEDRKEDPVRDEQQLNKTYAGIKSIIRNY